MKTSNKYLRILLLLALFPLTFWAQDGGPATKAGPLPAMPYRLTIDASGLEGSGITTTVTATPVPVPDPLTDAAYTLDVPASGAYVHSNGQSDANAASVRITFAGTSADGRIYSPIVTAGTGSAAVPVTTGTSGNDQPQWTFRMPAAAATITFVPKGTEDNPYVIDLGNITPGNGAANGYTYDSSLGRITLTADGATYKLSGEAPDMTLLVGSKDTQPYVSCVAQIDGTVSLKNITVNGFMGGNTFTLKGPEGNASSFGLVVKNTEAGKDGIAAGGRVLLSGNLTVECYGQSNGIAGYLTVGEGARLYGYGDSGATGEAYFPGINWEFNDGAPFALPVVKDAEGKEVYNFGAFSTTFPGTPIPKGFFLTLPEDDTAYTLWLGDKQLYGMTHSEDGTFIATGSFVRGKSYINVSTPLSLDEITIQETEALSLKFLDNHWTWKVGESGTFSAFSGKVQSEGKTFGNSINIDNNSGQSSALTFSNMKLKENEGVDITGEPLTLHLMGDNRLGQLINKDDALTLTAEAGATLTSTTITNLATFTDLSGLVSSVLLDEGNNAPTLSSSITGTTGIPEGTTTTLSAAAKLTNGAAPAVSYQWLQQANGNWEDLAGKTGATLTVGIGSYRCLVTSVTLLPGSDAPVSTTLAPSVTVTQTSEPDPEPDPVYYSVTVPAVKGASINPTSAVYTIGAGEDHQNGNR